MEVVNGVPCFNCTDVEKAKKIDTAPRQNQTLEVSAQTRSFATPNQPLEGGPRGTQLNFST